ncbi:MAG: ATP-binding protein [Nitrospiraceae bacterium]|nr:ATP-binding protein [Nitrospiraceae bacterium]
MRSLFIKIFLWFWLAMILTSVTLVIITFGAQVGPIARHFRRVELERDRVLGQVLTVYGQTALKQYARGGLPALRRFSSGLERSTGIGLFLFADGNALSAGGPGPPPVIRDMAAKVRGAGGKNKNILSRIDGKGYVLVMPLAAANVQGRLYTVAGRWPDIPFRGVPSPKGYLRFFFGLRGLVSLIIGGIVCYGLAWRLTAPIRRLREATHQLAAGNLRARAGGRLSGRSDEIGALGRDFDGMAERIESLVGAQQRLIRDISHELRSPLARLRVALELARQKNKNSPEEAAGPLDRIEREAERLNRLIAELVTLTLLESGTERLEKTLVDLPLLVHEIAGDSDFEARGMNRSVKFLPGDDGQINIFASPEMLRRAIENVVRNALRYTPEGDEVEITMERLQRNGRPHALIRVRDHGPGVPEEALKEIFRPFFRVTEARDRVTGGAGIGLAITERAVHLHGGEVTAVNAPGGGLLVEIDLPADRDGETS